MTHLLGPGNFGRLVVLGETVQVLVELLHSLLVRHTGLFLDPFYVSLLFFLQESNLCFRLFGIIFSGLATMPRPAGLRGLLSGLLGDCFGNGLLEISIFVLGLLLFPACKKMDSIGARVSSLVKKLTF